MSQHGYVVVVVVAVIEEAKEVAVVVVEDNDVVGGVDCGVGVLMQPHKAHPGQHQTTAQSKTAAQHQNQRPDNPCKTTRCINLPAPRGKRHRTARPQSKNLLKWALAKVGKATGAPFRLTTPTPA